MEPVKEAIRRGSVDSAQKEEWGCEETRTHIRSPSQESIEELASPSREGPAGAGPVAIEVEDKRRNSRYIRCEGARGPGREEGGETGDGFDRRPR